MMGQKDHFVFMNFLLEQKSHIVIYGGAEGPVEQKNHNGAGRPDLGAEEPLSQNAVEQTSQNGAERPLLVEQLNHFLIYIYT